MADTDKATTASTELIGTSETGALGLQAVAGEEVVAKHVDNAPARIFPDCEAADKVLMPGVESGSSVRPSTSSAPGSSPLPSFSQPKKFSAVNINKKFLEKNSSASGPSQSSSSSTTVKSGSPAPRPAVQASSSHSRLVTTKLTATLPTTSTTGPGWSRPASSPSPVTATNAVPNPPTTSTSATPTAAPQPPHAGKVIQPQPRAVMSGIPTGGSQKDGSASSSKPVWGNVRTVVNAALKADFKVQNDFPTAAEVAQVRIAKISDTKEAAETAAAHKQARMEEADTFRGVHLDPNAHHWDEMEEDDDNFLDGVIEFGDGRQYKIPTAELPPQPPSPSREPPRPIQSNIETPSGSAGSVHIPVSKEERFADDFDRRWPRSKPSPPLSAREFPTPGPHPVPISPVPSHALQSPQESSRVLFNERSNRLEPYSNSHPPHRPGQSPFPSKRGNQPDLVPSPTESRNSRDLPPHTQAHSGVQLLQKPANVPVADFHPRPRGLSSGFGSGPSNIFVNDRPRDRENYRRDSRPLSPSHSSPHSPDLKRARDYQGSFGPQHGSSGSRERDFAGERGRRTSTMGPPLLPIPVLQGKSKEAGRQLPPHLSHIPPLLTQRRMPSQDSQSRPSPTVPRGDSSSLSGTSVQAGLQSPVLSHASVTSPVSDRSPQVSAIPVIDMDEVRKDVMQSAAARAKQRRRQEEEEREKEKERARRKAAELEEKIKAAEAEKAKPKPPEKQISQSQEEKVIQIIEEAVQNAEVQTDAALSEPSAKSVSQSPKLRRPPSLKTIPRQPVDPSRPMLSRRTSQTPQTPMTPSVLATPAAQAESWRSKAISLPPATPRQAHVRESALVFPPPPPTAVEQVESLIAHSGEELEVVDFSDLGKFVGIPDTPPIPPVEELASPGFIARPSRPVASDFFDDRPPAHDPATSSKSSFGHWRRKPSQDLTPVVEQTATTYSATKEHSRSDVVTGAEESNDAPPVSSTGSVKGVANSADYSSGPTQIITVSSHSGPQRTPRVQTFYREAAMSALDDAMSRIKGALDYMQANEPPKEMPQCIDLDVPPSAKPRVPPSSASLKSGKESRWIPPALRVQHYDLESREVFHVTGCEPPRTPKSAWNACIVRLPSISHMLEPPSRRQLHLFRSMPAPARWDILSWEPQVEGMNRRDYSLNDVLFPKPQMHKGKHRYRVILPKLRAHPFNAVGVLGPKVNLPHVITPRLSGTGAFGRPADADGQPTWRKPPLPKIEGVEMISELSTVSRSPPPDLPPAISSVTSMPNTSASVKDGLLSPVRSRSQPKMPAGSVVAFYRDSRIDTVESDPQTFVNFVFDSELEELSQSQSSMNQLQPVVTLSCPSSGTPNELTVKPDAISPVHPMVNGLDPQPVSPELSMPPLVQSESKTSDDSNDHAPTPPTHPNDIWTKAPLSFPIKESPARAPDPEHLKAVWSQASDKARLPAVNSLEGIADDLTALPFTLQDVKSDDGEALGQTPPPSTSMAPSRMSLHDVTRAFQQVPSSSSSSNGHRSATLSPPSTAVPLVRQPSYGYSLPPPNPNLRPSYAPYPPPMMSHSPSPTVMYTHPIAHSPVPSRIPVNGHTPIYSPPVWMPLPGPAGQSHGGMIRPLPSPYPAQLMSYPSPGTPTMYAPPPANLQSPPPQQNGSQVRGRGMPLMSPVMSHAGPHPNVQMYPGSPVLMHALPQSHGYMPMPAGRRNDNSPMQQQSSGQPSHAGFTPVPPTSFLRTNW